MTIKVLVTGHLAAEKRVLTIIFSSIVALVGVYVILRGIAPYI
jgi:hypothetical protein